jgi:glycerate kinase
MSIPDTLLVAVCSFCSDLPAERAAEAIAKGILAAGRPEPDLCPIDGDLGGGPAVGQALGAALNAVDFDERLKRARAVIVGAGLLSRETLPGSPVFEIATRARQGGVPAYAVTAHNDLDPFDARMLDLQVILEATGARGLAIAGRQLAEIA